MPLVRRIPKRGFTNPFTVDYQVVNLSSIEKKFNAGDTVDAESLRKARLVTSKGPIKLLANGDLTKAVTIKVDKASAAAVKKVTDAGGTCEIPNKA